MSPLLGFGKTETNPNSSISFVLVAWGSNKCKEYAVRSSAGGAGIQTSISWPEKLYAICHAKLVVVTDATLSWIVKLKSAHELAEIGFDAETPMVELSLLQLSMMSCWRKNIQISIGYLHPFVSYVIPCCQILKSLRNWNLEII